MGQLGRLEQYGLLDGQRLTSFQVPSVQQVVFSEHSHYESIINN